MLASFHNGVCTFPHYRLGANRSKWKVFRYNPWFSSRWICFSARDKKRVPRTPSWGKVRSTNIIHAIDVQVTVRWPYPNSVLEEGTSMVPTELRYTRILLPWQVLLNWGSCRSRWETACQAQRWASSNLSCPCHYVTWWGAPDRVLVHQTSD